MAIVPDQYTQALASVGVVAGAPALKSSVGISAPIVFVAPGTWIVELDQPLAAGDAVIVVNGRNGWSARYRVLSPTTIEVTTYDATGIGLGAWDLVVGQVPLVAPPVSPDADPLGVPITGGGGGVPIMTSILWVNPRAIGSTEDGSLSNPYLTIGAAVAFLNAIPTPTLPTDPVLRTIFVVAISPASYDEDLAIDGTSKHIMLWGLGPWGLGTFDGPQMDPTGTPRNITHTVSAGNIDNIRHSFGVGTFGPWPGEGLTTHPSYNTGARISGRIIMDDLLLGGTTVELYVAAQVYDAAGTGFSIEAAQSTVAPGVLQTYLYRSRFASVVGGGVAKRMRVQVADRCRFDGLVDVNRFSFIDRSQFAAGMTLVSASADIQPSGMLDTNFAGTLTGPAGCGRMNGNTNFWFKANAAVLGGAATKVIQDDLVP